MKPSIEQRKQAESLRRKGWSYGEIRRVVPVAKSSLSLWLRGIKLTHRQRKRLEELNTVGQKLGARARRQQRLDRFAELKKDTEHDLPALLKNNFFMLGLALYWAEGSKQKPWNISVCVMFANSDPLAVLVMRKWFQQYCNIDESQIVYRLHIHNSANVKQARIEWGKILNVTPETIAVSLKHNISKFRHNQGHSYKGLIRMKVNRSTWLNRKIDLWVKAAGARFLSSSAYR